MRLTAVALFCALSGFAGGCEREAAKTVLPGGRAASSDAGLPPERIDRVTGPFNRGIALMDQYKPVEAAKAFEEVVRAAPDWITGRVNLGIALLNTGRQSDYARCEQELRWVIDRDPTNPHAHYSLGLLLGYLSRPDEAKARFESVLETDPEDADTHYHLGILMADIDPVAARKHFEKTLQKIPHHEAACYRLYALLRRAGETHQAQEVLSRYQALKDARAGVSPGMKYGEMGRYADVLRAFGAVPAAAAPNPVPAFQDIAENAGLTSVSSAAAGWPGESGRGGSPDFAPGVAVADVEGTGETCIYITGIAPGGGALYRFRGGRFSQVRNTGIDGKNAIGATFGDYDGDGDPDLYLTCDGPNRLYRNEGRSRFADVTRATGTSGGDVLSVGAAWADADHDGDLDLYVADFSASPRHSKTDRGAANFLFRNNGNGTFTDVATEEGIDGGKAASAGVLFFDFDDDHDLDLYLINHSSPGRLFLNDRAGRYTEAPSLFSVRGDSGFGIGAVVGDVDQNGQEDILLLRGSRPPRLFLKMDRGLFAEDTAFATLAARIGGAAGGILADLDLDGALDLVLLSSGVEGSIGDRIFMNAGAGRFSSPVLLGPERAVPDTRGAVATDLDGDGMPELLVARAGARPQLWRAPPPVHRHWLEVVPAGKGETKPFSIDPSAYGLLVEVKSGRLLQVGRITTSTGYLASTTPSLRFGLGDRATADYVRLVWPDATLQSEMEVAADRRWRVTKMERKASSCPVLFSWDGGRFAFVTDFLGVGGLGFFISPGTYAPPDPTEDVRIPPELIAPRAGRYLIRVAEPLEEVTYMDGIQLVAHDHPDTLEVYPDERFTGTPPFATGVPVAVSEKLVPKAAHNEQGEDVLERILHIDRRTVEPPKDARFIGYAQDHWIELDFGESLGRCSPDAALILCLYGWVEYTYSHVNYAAWQAGVTMRSPFIEVPDGEGGWRVAVPEMGFPAGLPRMMTFDISSLPLRKEGRFRIRTNMEVYWDHLFVGKNSAGSLLRSTTMPPVVAELRHLGYPREYSPDGADPMLYDYGRIDQGAPFKNMAGDFTRIGGVRELLRDVDDRFVVFGKGEEIALEFDAASLPVLPAGWSRTIVLHADGFCKDMDMYTAFPGSVEPLPYHGMKNYPPDGSPRNRTALAAYRRTWNTRHVAER